MIATYIGALYVILPALLLLLAALVPTFVPAVPFADAVAAQDASVRECRDVCAHEALRYAYAAHAAMAAGIDARPMRQQAIRFYRMAVDYDRHLNTRCQV